MRRNLLVVILLAVVIALPFIFRQPVAIGDWRSGDPVLTVVTPHNEAIRYEFGRAFSLWHQAHYGQPVKIDWRALGGTSEIMRYLAGEYASAFRAWWLGQGRAWPDNGAELILDRRFKPDAPPPADAPSLATWAEQREVYLAFRQTDDAHQFGCRIDILFGGGVYDHQQAAGQGLLVAPWSSTHMPPDLFTDARDGTVLIPEGLAGEPWRSDLFFGTALSTFGIVYNRDRLVDLGISTPPTCWEDLTDSRYFQHLGVADPTKSGSIAKAFEMIVYQQCVRAVRQAGFDAAAVAAVEQRIQEGGEGDVPPAYAQAIETGWLAGIRLLQIIGANARYFTDGAGRIPVDVSAGNAAAGVAIDFYGRFQAEVTTPPDGTPRMEYITPRGGSSISADPISLLRGAREPELARRFIAFVLSAEGQALWNYRKGAPGGPATYALRRLPIRREFYPCASNAVLQARYEVHRTHTVDALGSPEIDPYALADGFHYYARWTGGHFNAHRYLIRAMCMDAGDELRMAWSHILAHGGPSRQPAAMALLQRLPDVPEPVAWPSVAGMVRQVPTLDLMRLWTGFFRRSYREAYAAVVVPGND